MINEKVFNFLLNFITTNNIQLTDNNIFLFVLSFTLILLLFFKIIFGISIRRDALGWVQLYSKKEIKQIRRDIKTYNKYAMY